MRRLSCVIAALALAGTTVTVHADPGRDESGHGRYKHERSHKGGEYKEEYWDGACKVERKWERNGNFKEERKCEGRGHHSSAHGHPAAGPGVAVQQPGIVIQPPAIVIR